MEVGRGYGNRKSCIKRRILWVLDQHGPQTPTRLEILVHQSLSESYPDEEHGFPRLSSDICREIISQINILMDDDPLGDV